VTSPIDDGGPAFPQPPFLNPNGQVCTPGMYYAEAVGMTLRDYFAAKVMQAIVAGDGARMVAARDGRYDETNWGQIVAANAYEMADAMLTHRAKKGSTT
jgi:hypothetical protein